MATDITIAQRVANAGLSLADARVLRPTDIVEGVLALRRHGEHRVLPIPRMTAIEATYLLGDAKRDGWEPVRWLRIGPEKSIAWRLGYAR